MLFSIIWDVLNWFSNFKAALEQLQKSLTVTGSNDTLAQKLEEQIEHLQLSGTLHPDQLHICPVSPIPTSPPPIRETEEPLDENGDEVGLLYFFPFKTKHSTSLFVHII